MAVLKHQILKQPNDKKWFGTPNAHYKVEIKKLKLMRPILFIYEHVDHAWKLKAKVRLSSTINRETVFRTILSNPGFYANLRDWSAE